VNLLEFHKTSQITALLGKWEHSFNYCKRSSSNRLLCYFLAEYSEVRSLFILKQCINRLKVVKEDHGLGSAALLCMHKDELFI